MALRRCQMMINRMQCSRTACWFKMGDVAGRYDMCGVCYALSTPKPEDYTNNPAVEAPKPEGEPN